MSAYGLDPGQVRHGLVREERDLEGTRRSAAPFVYPKFGSKRYRLQEDSHIHEDRHHLRMVSAECAEPAVRYL